MIWVGEGMVGRVQTGLGRCWEVWVGCGDAEESSSSGSMDAWGSLRVVWAGTRMLGESSVW